MNTRVSAVLVSLMLTFALPVGAAIPSLERNALIAFYNATGGANWTNKTNWLGAAGTECTWFGVSCDGNSVGMLILQSNNLTGEIPTDIVQLSSVHTFRLDDNTLAGAIPPEIGQMVALEDFSISANALTGSIPPELGALTALTRLFLHKNALSGSIPTTLCQISGLAELHLWENQLSGPIPDCLGQLQSMRDLVMTSNKLDGPIPISLTNLPNLEVLYLAENNLTGSIPSSIGNLANLQVLSVERNQLTGSIPDSLGNLVNLQHLGLFENELTGEIPVSLGNLVNLAYFDAYRNKLTGGIPETFANLSSLVWLALPSNRLDGPIPVGLAQLTNLQLLDLSSNSLTGSIPPELGNLAALEYLDLSANRLTGSIPQELGDLTALESLGLGINDLSGPLPASLGNLSNLTNLYIPFTDITGPIPSELGNLTQLIYFDVGVTRLSGELPSSLGNLTNLQYLKLWYNAFTGEVPASFAGLTNLIDDDGLGLAFNGLYTSNPNLRAFLDLKEYGTYPFESLQTLAPSTVAATAVSPAAINVSWTPIDYQFDPGGYRVEVATSPNGPFTLATTTSDKSVSLTTVARLNAATQYYVRVSTVTFANGAQKNTVISHPTATIAVTTQPSAPAVVLTRTPELLTVIANGTSTTSTSYTLSNIGQSATQIQLTQNGSFFTQSPASFVLGAGATQTVTITSLPQAAATSFRGTSTPAGNGVPSSLVVPVSLLAATPLGVGDPQVIVVSQRVDVAAPAGTNPSGSVTFKNIGTAPATGLLAADVAWIVPDPGTIVLAPGEEKPASFTIDRARRPDAGALAGTMSATLSFVYITRGTTAPGRATHDAAPTLATPITVGDTVTPPVVSDTVPALADGEIGLVIAGMNGALGRTDIAIGNPFSGLLASDLKLYFSEGTSAAAATQPVEAGASVVLADVLSTVFDASSEAGALHVRSSLAPQLGMSASVVSGDGLLGTRGTALPVFRTDRAIEKGETSMVTGLQKSASRSTSIVIQEVQGAGATVDLEFMAAGGGSLGVLADQAMDPLGSVSIANDLVPEGAVSVRVSNEGDGAVVAYAMMLDLASGDRWTVTDWNVYYGRNASDAQVVPVAGSLPGRNDTYFRTDLAIANPGDTPSSGTLRYYQQEPFVAEFDQPVQLEASATLVLQNVVTHFGVGQPSVGHLVLLPETGSMTMTSRTYTTTNGTTQTYGTGVPALSRSAALRLGQGTVIGSLQDSSGAVTSSGQAGTFRSNLGIVETEGKSVTVRVSLQFFDGRSFAVGGSVAAKTYTLGPHELLQLNEIAAQIIGPTRESDYGELDNVQVSVEVTAGDGGVVVWTSATDNGSGDTTLRVE